MNVPAIVRLVVHVLLLPELTHGHRHDDDGIGVARGGVCVQHLLLHGLLVRDHCSADTAR